MEPHDQQAVAVALDVARNARAKDGPFNIKGVHKDAVSKSPKLHVGPIHSAVAGRTDHLPMHVPPDAYVLPADVVSALGEGNTAAGFKVARSLFEPPEWFKGLPGVEAFSEGAPGAEAIPTKAEGGATNGVPIIAAGGEHVISPRGVQWMAHRFGGGATADGHRIIDEFVKQVRAKNIKTLTKLPGPKKD